MPDNDVAAQLRSLLDAAPKGGAVLIRFARIPCDADAEPTLCVEVLSAAAANAAAVRSDAETAGSSGAFGYGEDLPHAVALCSRMQVESSPAHHHTPLATGNQCGAKWHARGLFHRCLRTDEHTVHTCVQGCREVTR